MRFTTILGFALTTFAASSGLAQDWEIGVLGGFGWYNNATLTTPAGKATAGFEPRLALGVLVDENLYRYFGGELRYMYLAGGPVLKFNGIESRTSGFTHVIHYDLLIHLTPRESRVRPYFAAGAGIKVYSGTDNEFLDQPLTNFATIRNINQVEALISAGGGVKFMFRKHGQFRMDYRTYLTPFPDQLFTPVPRTRISGWIINFVPSAGFSYVF